MGWQSRALPSGSSREGTTRRQAAPVALLRRKDTMKDWKALVAMAAVACIGIAIVKSMTGWDLGTILVVMAGVFIWANS